MMKIIMLNILLIIAVAWSQDLLLSDDFNDGNIDNWSFFGYSTGLHEVIPPEVVDGRVEILTRDQQATYFSYGDEDWNEYSLELDVRIEESLDDGYKGIYIYFYLTNIHYNEDLVVYNSSYLLNIKGRTDEWRLKRIDHDDTTDDNLINGDFDISVGIDYHLSISVSETQVTVYLNEVGETENLLTQIEVESNPLDSGIIAIGGADDRISIDNVVVESNEVQIDECTDILSLEYINSTQSEMDDIYVGDGVPVELNPVLAGDYIHRVDIWGGGGYYSHTYMMMCLESMATGVLVRGTSDDNDVDRTGMGLDPDFEDMFDFNGLGWLDATGSTQGTEWYLELNSMWGSDIDTHIEIWIASDNPFETIGYGLLDEYDDDFGSFVVTSYLISDSPLELGDVTQDGSIDILDIVMTVGFILGSEFPTENEAWAADFNQDGSIDILDIVGIIDVILNGQAARNVPIRSTDIELTFEHITLTADGTIAGFQLHTAGYYTILDHNLPAGWQLHSENDQILAFSTDGSIPDEDIRISFHGDLNITSVLVADWHGNGMAASVQVIPSQVLLHPAYPNPFNPRTQLQFDLPEAGPVELVVFDLNGREVARLVDERRSAGSHRVIWDAHEQSSGIYFVKLTAGSQQTTRQLLLLK